MTNAAGLAAINLNLVARVHEAAFCRLRGARRVGGRRREGWSCIQADAAEQNGSRDGKLALPRAPHLGNASRKAQNLLGENLGLTSGRALISLFSLYHCLQLDPLSKCLPTFIRHRLDLPPPAGHQRARTGGETVLTLCVPSYQQRPKGYQHHVAAKLGAACPHSNSSINLRRNKAINRGTRG